MTNTQTTGTEILSIHTLTYRYRCSLQTYYGLFQYLVQNRNCIFAKRKQIYNPNIAPSRLQSYRIYRLHDSRQGLSRI